MSRSEDAVVPPSEQDARLVPSAVVLWLGALLGLLCGWWTAIVCGGVAAVVAAAVLVCGRRALSARWKAGAVALLVAAFVVACPMALRFGDAEHHPMRDAAARSAGVALRVTIAERPRPVRSAGYAGQRAGARSVVFAADVDQAIVDGRDSGSGGRVVVIGSFDSWAALLPGQEVTLTGSLAPPRGHDLTVAAVLVRGPPAEAGQAPWWQRGAETLRAGLRKACAVLDEEPAGLVPGLVTGDTAGLPERVRTEFTDAGMSHLTAVSGSNLAIACGAVLILLRMCRLGPRFSAIAAGFALAGFVLLAGPEPSVLRAGAMGAVGLLALALGRKRSALPALATTVCVLITADPAMAVDLGFALSVAATAGLVLLAPRWSAALVRRGVPPGFADGIAVPLAAFVVTAPVLAGMVGTVSAVSVLANVLAAPVVAPATVFGVLATLVAAVWPWGGEALVRLAGPEADWLITVARHGAAVPDAMVPWPSGWWGGLLAVVVLVTIVLAFRRRGLRLLLAVALACVLLVVVTPRVVAPAWPPTGWAMAACDVGQGDAVVLGTAEPGRAVVVDTGPEPGPVDRCLDALGVDRVPLVVLSHLHADHIGGLASVFEGRSVGAVAIGPGRSPPWAWRQVAETAAKHGVPLLDLATGQRLDWPGLTLDVIGPRFVPARPRAEPDGTGINNTSLVVRAATAAGTVLLTGDVEVAAQGDLLAGGADLHADVLKVPHHGSRYSIPRFLAETGARVAMVSVGAGNTYGHPNKSTVDELTAMGALVGRTDTDGDLAVVADRAGPALVRRGQETSGRRR
ncbi:ComEC/Rec2 family competence protein [Amycolatopsis minnesotensis]|uniref:ComEC/Rec2 family competence protein n=1 Tax=Amycolatopsis minnesotensis TaxID=337894 RepID=A0ABN2QEQ0_9PSEU